MTLPFRFLRTAAFLVVAAAWTAPPAAAYRVFLDADEDNDPTTFRNEVTGPVETPVTLVVSLDEGDAALTEIFFRITWDCTPDTPGCYLAAPHGEIGFSPLDDTYPFSGIEMAACTGLGCDCMATRHFSAFVDTPAVGYWVLATLPFTRQGMGSNCAPLLYPEVEFRVDCDLCDYAPGHDPFTRMVLRGDSPATNAPGEKVAAPWGRVKALYR